MLGPRSSSLRARGTQRCERASDTGVASAKLLVVVIFSLLVGLLTTFGHPTVQVAAVQTDEALVPDLGAEIKRASAEPRPPATSLTAPDVLVSTIAGSSKAADHDGNGSVATIDKQFGVAILPTGNTVLVNDEDYTTISMISRGSNVQISTFHGVHDRSIVRSPKLGDGNPHRYASSCC